MPRTPAVAVAGASAATGHSFMPMTQYTAKIVTTPNARMTARFSESLRRVLHAGFSRWYLLKRRGFFGCHEAVACVVEAGCDHDQHGHCQPDDARDEFWCQRRQTRRRQQDPTDNGQAFADADHPALESTAEEEYAQDREDSGVEDL